MAWLDKALEIIAGRQSCVLVTVARTRGSTPREAGAKMLVWNDGVIGSVGGGRLELDGLLRARTMLADADLPGTQIEQFVLGPQLAQCCGGSVALLFERLAADALAWLTTWAEYERAEQDCLVITNLSGIPNQKTFVRASDPLAQEIPAPVAECLSAFVAGAEHCLLIERGSGQPSHMMETIGHRADDLFLFGAGHVGKAVVRALEPLPFRITWIDSRDDTIPAALPVNTTRRVTEHPPLEVDTAPAGAFFLVMTHSHPLDLDICARVLQRDDFAFLGLIGSETKRARFSGRLRAIGIPPQALGRLACPIGIPGIASKEPAAIAAAVAAQLLILAERHSVRLGQSMAVVGADS